MFNEAMSREMLLPSSGVVNDYVAHIYSKYKDLDGNNRNADVSEKRLHNSTN